MALDVEQQMARVKPQRIDDSMNQKQESRFSPSKAGECESETKGNYTQYHFTVHVDNRTEAYAGDNNQYNTDNMSMTHGKTWKACLRHVTITNCANTCFSEKSHLIVGII